MFWRGIAASKSRGLTRLLNALAIRHVGTRVATVLAERFGTMDRAAVRRVRGDPGHGGRRAIIARAYTTGCTARSAAETVDDLQALVLDMDGPHKAVPAGGGKLSVKPSS